MDIILSGPHKDFEAIKKVDENGVEYWNARDLMPVLGYEKWQNAEEVIGRAARACLNSGQVVDNHFTVFSKMVSIGSDTMRKIKEGDDMASRTHFMVGGKVRQTIKDIGGEMPENLPPEKHIKELKKEKKELERSDKKRIKQLKGKK